MPFTNSPKTPNTPSTPRSTGSSQMDLMDNSALQLLSDKIDNMSSSLKNIKKTKDDKDVEKEILDKVKMLEEKLSAMTEEKKAIKPPVYEFEERIDAIKNPLEELQPLKEPLIRKRSKLPIKNLTNPEGHQRKSIHDETESIQAKKMIMMDRNNHMLLS